MKLIIDLMGLDLGPEEMMYGILNAAKNSKLDFVLSGPEELARKMVSESDVDINRFEFIDTNEYITNEDDPARSIRRKKNSSLVLGLDRLNEEGDGLLSAGSTGALVAGGIFVTRRLEKVERSTLTAFIPNQRGTNTILVDTGAVVDSKPEMLSQFAVMGSVLAEKYFSIDNPKVYLANVGVEEGKGDVLSKETFDLLKENDNINFCGNIEARDFLTGKADVIVADGFAGNMMLKSSEGAASVLFGEIKEVVNSSFLAKMGALLLKSSLKKIKDKYDYKKVGAAVLVGLRKPLFKAHGSSDRVAIEHAIYRAEEYIGSDINKYIEERL
ncbi:fatty acid/phospholipid synthesis protein PlsX [Helcococcus kunzii ATCC 51366]|uniref:Phosphate acyltransferase n=1 Tax=Helcococcus kunzii ATCC 51366 TaxID=883114 RepID=H3NNH1_9FIRM|nr:phosphate acyltransferase PlsX [Helcococcus kunzii]EHR33946.1 fatty acid/phospholipid synthesis protein PlsX [Helcococcus kunzii ATCC 51366]